MKTQVVLITGTSRGLGAHLVTALEAAGHVVYGSSRQPSPGQARVLALDVTDPAAATRAVAAVLDHEGRLDVLINNAGSHLLGAALETSHAELRAQLALNFLGAVHMTTAALPSMLEQGHGRIVNLSSVGGRLATPLTSAYNASKFALEGYMEALRLELLHTGVFVSNLEPAFLATGTTDVSVQPVQGEHPRFTAAREATHQRMLAEAKSGAPLQSVARAVLDIMASPRPALRHSVDGFLPRLELMRTVTPASWFERMVVRSTAPALLQGA